jgi:ornithine carbamoyltransferase
MVMHDMPMHPGYEISKDIVDKHLETILDEAENRRHAEKGLLVYLITGKLDW